MCARLKQAAEKVGRGRRRCSPQGINSLQSIDVRPLGKFSRSLSSDGIDAFGLKQRRQGGLPYLSHRIARERIDHQQPRRQFVSCQQFSGPSTEALQIENIAIFQHHRRGDTLAPLCIGYADHRTFGNCGMPAQRLFNLQSGYFVATGLEYVDVRSTKDAVDTVLDDRGIAGDKPAIAKGIACGVWSGPILCEDRWTADFYPARYSWAYGMAMLSDKPHLDAR